MVDTAFAAPHRVGVIGFDAAGNLVGRDTGGARDRVERAPVAALGAPHDGNLFRIRRSVARGAAVAGIEGRLAERGLLIPRRTAGLLVPVSVALAVLVPLAQPATLGVLVIGPDGERLGGHRWLPAPVLPAAVGTALIAARVGGRAGAGPTAAGRRALRAYRAGRYGAGSRTADGPALAVSLHGPSRIPDPVLRTPRPSPSSPRASVRGLRPRHRRPATDRVGAQGPHNPRVRYGSWRRPC
ncbi:TIGR04222 domain-containing membrane protein [Streptomyces sp. VRA16 Mangrove soil]|nr:TIGR04222 domain-containing membrane protein [Streptomyces sp. VRA16 Mangrove soil]